MNTLQTACLKARRTLNCTLLGKAAVLVRGCKLGSHIFLPCMLASAIFEYHL